jgi:hypothetical protein
MQKTRRIGMLGSVVCVAMMMALAGSVHAATWSAGGDGNWAGIGDNWGLGAGAYPGDGSHVGENVTVTDGSTITIDSDIPNQLGNTMYPFHGTLVVTNGGYLRAGSYGVMGSGYNSGVTTVVNQVGGMLQGGTRFSFGPSGSQTGNTMTYNLSGGVFAPGGDFRFCQTTPGSGTSVSFYQTGGVISNTTSITMYNTNSLVEVSGGTFTPNNIKIDQGSGDPVFRIVGSDALVDVNTLAVIGDADAGRTSMEFILDASGVTPLLSKQINLNTCNLTVDVTAMASDGTAGLLLMDSETTGQFGLYGAWGTITILDDGTPMTEAGSKVGLESGYYFLESNPGTSDKATLYYNNAGGPKGTVVSIK